VGDLAYGFKIKVPTTDVKDWGCGYSLDSLRNGDRYQRSCTHRSTKETHQFEMVFEKVEYYGSVPIAENAFKEEVGYWTEWRQGSSSAACSIWNIPPELKEMKVVNNTHMITHLFNVPAEGAVMEQLNESKIPDELKSAFKSSNCPLSTSTEAVVGQTSIEDC